MTKEFREHTQEDIARTRKRLEDIRRKRFADIANTKTLRSFHPFKGVFSDIEWALRALTEIEKYTLNSPIDDRYWDDFQVYVRKTDEIWKQNFNDHMTKYRFNHETNKIERKE